MIVEFLPSNGIDVIARMKDAKTKSIVICDSRNSFIQIQLKIFELCLANRAIPILASQTSAAKIIKFMQERNLIDHSMLSNSSEINPEFIFLRPLQVKNSEVVKSERIGVLLRHWDAYELTKNCIDDLLATTYGNLEVAVLDDASKDLSYLEIFFRYSDVHVIRSLHKLEYCSTFNLLSRYTENLSVDFLFIVNNDTRKFSSHMFEELVSVFEDQSIGIASPRVMDYAGNLIVKQDRKWLGIQFNIATEGYLIPLRVWKKIGGFNSNLIRFAEDLEFVFELQKLGLRQARVDTVNFDHLGHGSSSRLNFVPVYYYARNLIWIQKIYFPQATLWPMAINSIKKTWPMITRRNSLDQKRYFFRKFFYLCLGTLSGLTFRLEKRPDEVSIKLLMTDSPLGRIKSKLS
jgi:GT2 family glycosyltransferase